MLKKKIIKESLDKSKEIENLDEPFPDEKSLDQEEEEEFKNVEDEMNSLLHPKKKEK